MAPKWSHIFLRLIFPLHLVDILIGVAVAVVVAVVVNVVVLRCLV